MSLCVINTLRWKSWWRRPQCWVSFFSWCVDNLHIRIKLISTVSPSLDPFEAFVIFSIRHEIRRIDLHKRDYSLLVPGLRNTIALDFHFNHSLLYWTDVVEDKIYRGKLSESGGMLSHTVSKDLHASLIFPLRQRRWYCSVLFCCCHTDSFLLHRADIVSLQFISGWPNLKILHKSKAFVVQSLIKWWIRISHSLFIFVGGSAFTEFPSLYLPLWSSRYHLCGCSTLCETPTKVHPSENRWWIFIYF